MSKKQILTTKYANYSYDSSSNLLEEKWNNELGIMNEEDFKETIVNYSKLVNQYSIEKALIDAKEFNFVINTDVQDWQNREVFQEIKTPVKKIAFLLPVNTFEEYSIKQVMDEQQALNNHKEVQYFENEQDATNWLLK